MLSPTSEAQRRPYLIAVAGPSCSGKTRLSWLARTLAAPVVSLDSYYHHLPHLSFAARAAQDFDEPGALEVDLLLQHLGALSVARAIDKPVYDFTVHLRAARTERIEPGPFVIVEGLFALYWDPLRRLCGTKVYVDVADDVCLARRLKRDREQRARSRESILAQYDATVRPGARRYIWPTREHADLVVSGSDPVEEAGAAVLRHVNA